jgi:hypothetical protein
MGFHLQNFWTDADEIWFSWYTLDVEIWIYQSLALKTELTKFHEKGSLCRKLVH